MKRIVATYILLCCDNQFRAFDHASLELRYFFNAHAHKALKVSAYDRSPT